MVTFTVLFMMLIMMRIMLPQVGSLALRIVCIGLSFPIFTFLGGGLVWLIVYGDAECPTIAVDLLRCAVWGGIPCGFFGSLVARRVLLTGFTFDNTD
jgi:hypothetical protein